MARLGGARSALLGADGLADVLGRATAEERLAALRASLWSAAADAAWPAAADASLGDAARREAVRLLRDLPAAAKRLVGAFLLPDDARAVRGALRAVAKALPPEHAASLLDPTPALSRQMLQGLAACPDATAAAALLARLGSPLAPALRETEPDLRKAGAMLAAELALDRTAAAVAAGTARGPGDDRSVLRRLVSARADSAAASELLALAGEPGREAFPVAGGERIPPAEARRLSELPPGARPAALARRLADLLGDPDTAAPFLSRPAAADHVLGRGLARFARRMARRAPLTVAVPCAFLVELGEELRRVRLVLHATAEGFPPAALAELLEA
jgi:vacuolar-type H+-ATPase subunit C/Vma6